jgi:hypothetical protein
MPAQQRSMPMRLAVRFARRAVRTLPAPLRRMLEDRVFYAVFQSTRVTNDNYGWRPEEEEKT